MSSYTSQPQLEIAPNYQSSTFSLDESWVEDFQERMKPQLDAIKEAQRKSLIDLINGPILRA